MSTKKHTKPKVRLFHPVTLAITMLVMSIVGYYSYNWVRFSHTPKYETEANIVKNIPQDVRNTLPASNSASLRVPILMYHYVEYVKDSKDTMRQSLNITPDVFELQIKTLKDANYTFMTTAELGEVLDGKRQLPNSPVILTFDDGYRDLATDVLPILKKYNAHATAYIVPSFVNGPNSVNDAQLDEVFKSGLVEIAAHTIHHLYLKGLNPTLALKEITDSKKQLEERLHTPIVSFAYPYGAFDLSTIKMVKEAGFTNATSTIPGIQVNQDNRFFIYRIRPGRRTGPELLQYLQQDHFKAF